MDTAEGSGSATICWVASGAGAAAPVASLGGFFDRTSVSSNCARARLSTSGDERDPGDVVSTSGLMRDGLPPVAGEGVEATGWPAAAMAAACWREAAVGWAHDSDKVPPSLATERTGDGFELGWEARVEGRGVQSICDTEGGTDSRGGWWAVGLGLAACAIELSCAPDMNELVGFSGETRAGWVAAALAGRVGGPPRNGDRSRSVGVVSASCIFEAATIDCIDGLPMAAGKANERSLPTAGGGERSLDSAEAVVKPPVALLPLAAVDDAGFGLAFAAPPANALGLLDPPTS